MQKPRGRDLGIPFEGQPGTWNAITDVPGVLAGHVTLISGEGTLEIGRGPVRTGVTAILPRGMNFEPVFGAYYSLNGCGEMTGTIWLEEAGFLYGPVMLTNTISVGTVHDALAAWGRNKFFQLFGMPVVTETYDGFLNDIHGFHVRQEHAWQALEEATSGAVAEGNVGGGTGMICHGFKGGIGTASRRLDDASSGYNVGVLVQANHGYRRHLTICGVPVGQGISDLRMVINQGSDNLPMSSIIVILATDCPLLPHQLKRLARRIPLGIGRVGGMGNNYSGDIFLAFSTTALGQEKMPGIRAVEMFANEKMNPLFEATIQATEEAIVNALVAAETMVGINGNIAYALPHERLQEALRKYNRL